jgi:hypothetical protein
MCDGWTSPIPRVCRGGGGLVHDTDSVAVGLQVAAICQVIANWTHPDPRLIDDCTL